MADIRPLTGELEEIARTQLNEDPGRMVDGIAQIKDFLNTQPHITARQVWVVFLDDQFLATFLRGCHFDVEEAKKKVENYYTMRTALPDWFARRDPLSPELQEVLSLGEMFPLAADRQGRPVWLIRLGAHDPSKVTLDDIMKTVFMMQEVIFMEDDAAVICGHTYLVDCAAIRAENLGQFTPAYVKKTMVCWQDVYPIRAQAINMLNMPPVFEAIFSLGMTLAKESFREKFFLHGNNMESVYNNVPKSILPSEYGGEAGSLSSMAAAWKNKLENYREYFLEEENYGSDESKRPGKPKTQKELFGLEGCFKQLAVD
ncbi:retinol-binding protein pinta [Anabrus simplex]|uniref:retinol-binding protein pinta n=1 Tax=Anabrus simplex TaxID=316456 RepID=UPI0035A2A5CB